MKLKLKSGVFLSGGAALDQAAGLVRNIILARTLDKKEFGIGVTFMIVVTLIETVTSFAADRVLVQDPDGDREAFQATAHFLRLLRGLLGAAVLFVLAPVLGWLFGIPEATGAYRLLALAPLFAGLQHLDVERRQRHLDFKPIGLVWAGPSLLSVALAYPLAAHFGDHRAVLWLILLRFFAATLVGHLSASRPYRFACAGEAARRIFHYGWPLIINGALLFLSLQGEKFIVGIAEKVFGNSNLTKESLAVFSMAYALCLMPVRFFGTILGNLEVPVLAKALDDKTVMAEKAAFFARCTAYLVCGFIVFTVGGGEAIMELAFGPRYAATGLLVPLLALAAGIRLLRISFVGVSLSAGKTTDPMLANVLRAAFLVPVLLVTWSGGSILLLAMVMVASDLSTTALAGRFAAKRLQTSAAVFSKILLSTLLVGVAFLLIRRVLGDLSPGLSLGIAAAAVPVLFGMSFVASPRFTQDLRRAMKIWRNR